MNLLMSLRISLRALLANKMRSFLTMLGIIIGIAAVIIIVAIGSGAQKVVSDVIASIGSNIILVIPGSTTSGGLRIGAGSVPSLTQDDARAINTELPSVLRAAPTVRGTAQVVAGNMNWSTMIMGVTPEFLQVREWQVVSGRELSPSDIEGASKNCILGQTVAENLFGSEDPIGKTVRIKRVPFIVVGLLDRKGQSPQGSDQDDIILLPLSTAQRKILGSQFPNTVGAIMVQAKSRELMDQAEEELTTLLDQRHRIGPAKERDYTVRNLTEILAASEQSQKMLTILFGAVASISLIVGGIGIMNIMLVSVTERTREIGIRMAIGARQRDILLQFLAEAVLLTLLGGVIGMAIGIGGATLISQFFGWPTMISSKAILLAFAFSGGVGIFFGFYPARKAAGLNPIEALRYE
ncbi:ABC transporter permease [Geobacter sulfurreducens]|uniref:ABC transporter, membrane protein n=1 Tax=Geobacter sulfurreducens (strain ATCC 51573 / DSM 12127 / PCA) TaxID=243231 RepID=I7EP07_GEOSL|nr:ABC transporter permease [Geobacter sulfurreducens]ADI83348.1 ABC transporter, membrane protein [Geobacter sulfurreducens KN400]AFP20390.1 ABC transporter, membrane protein [Geobacter sulfurreducens PCA]AJY70250.1 multidrug ABC transporter substrate-binding protein [Geobacter sulfurreducens]QVW35753.1 ABC transporter permease [Geobacter sulfurreducens]UAC04575.1 ABC transporter permease [Geobacter sulfurreducens]